MAEGLPFPCLSAEGRQHVLLAQISLSPQRVPCKQLAPCAVAIAILRHAHGMWHLDGVLQICGPAELKHLATTPPWLSVLCQVCSREPVSAELCALKWAW